MDKVIELLKKCNKTISTMESCTGGAVVNAITNIPGASDVIEYSAITYSNEYKIKMGVSRDIIDKYSVYSKETADEMSRAISLYANSNYGIGITGKLNRIDKNNMYGDDNKVFISIYDKDNDKYYNRSLLAMDTSREVNKLTIVNEIIDMLINIIK